MKPIQEAWSEALALAIENPDRKLAALGQRPLQTSGMRCGPSWTSGE